MAAIITRRKWTRQPSGPVEPAAYLRDQCTSLVSGADQIDVVAGSLTAAGGAGRIDDRGGIGLRVGGTSASYFASTIQETPTTSGLTLVLCVSLPDATAVSSVFGVQNVGYSYFEMLRLNARNAAFVAGGIDFNLTQSGNSITFSALNTTINDGNAHGIVIASGPGGGPLGSIYLDGVAQALTYTNSGYGWHPDGTAMTQAPYLCGSNVLGYGDYYYSLAAQRVYLFARILADLDAGEMANISANPYSILRPRTRRLYFGVAAGGANTIAVPKGSLSLTGYTPTIVNPQGMAIPKGALTLTAHAPAVNIGSGNTIAVPKASLALSAKIPVIVNPQGMTIPKGSLTLTGYAPAIVKGIVVTVPRGTLTLSAKVPTVANPKSVSIPKGALTFTGYAPGVSNGLLWSPVSGVSSTWTGTSIGSNPWTALADTSTTWTSLH